MDLARRNSPGVQITFLDGVQKMEGDHVRECSPKDTLDLWCEHTEPSPGTTLSTNSAQTQVQKCKAAVIPLDEETPDTHLEHMLNRLLRLEKDIEKLTDSDSIATLAARYSRLEVKIAAMADSEGRYKTKIAQLEDTVDFLLNHSATRCWSYLEPSQFQ